jgi:hypothetical protein
MQTLCAVFFLSDIVLTVLGVPFAPIPWAYREVMELAAGGALSSARCWARCCCGRRCAHARGGKRASRRVRRVHGTGG